MASSTPASRAVVLLSGGLDSAVTLGEALRAGFECIALSFDYGQRHKVELDAARGIVRAMGVSRHVEVPIGLRRLGGSALTSDIEVPKDRQEIGGAEDIPVTYVPARNLVFLSIGAALCEVVGARDLYIGVNALDYSGYPDCREEFIRAFEGAANLGTRAGVHGEGVRVRTPLAAMTKCDIVRRGVALGVPLALTRSCYDPGADGRACGHCDSCVLRARGFAQAGERDPALGSGAL
ncbi:MAG: 7-cyano-7-deazaguanine synthase QueC [Phycisphaerales bacterium]|nr:7-cyano-7-deazaguanine synthase QueC [Phycisphaerales bacterium]